MRSVHIGSALVLGVLAAIGTARAASAPSPPPRVPLVAYSCGFWGPSLTVWRGGRAILETPGPTDRTIERNFRLAPGTYRRLAATLAAAKFRTLRRVYGDTRRVPLPVYRTSCVVSHAGRRIVIHGDALPPRLRAVMLVLNAIVRANARR
jgi:hypothetical protein